MPAHDLMFRMTMSIENTKMLMFSGSVFAVRQMRAGELR